MQDIMNNILAATAVVGLFTGLLIEAVKRAEVVSTRVLPLLSLLLGMVMGYVIALGFNQDFSTFIAAGFIGGAMASGIYDSGSSVVAFLKDFLGGNK
ncbi:holin [Jeotgalibaca porci]|uniref:holin n=1 Tax=Jeotgalibaca porci TaxID=1868793 RepID=UPI0035A0EB96